MVMLHKNEAAASTKGSTGKEAFAATDTRFCNLLAQSDWQSLPTAVQRRFSKHVNGGESVVYVGRITSMRLSKLGYALANLLRLVGGPLPLNVDVGTPSIVSVTEDGVKGGQVWTRLYASKSGFPQMIHSAKRFSGRTGLEEYVGFGLSMALITRVVNRALHFESAGYALDILGKRFQLPRFLTPLDLVVVHEDANEKGFIFSLRLTNPFFGELIYQEGLYKEEQIL